jgi:hypothetical protein
MTTIYQIKYILDSGKAKSIIDNNSFNIINAWNIGKCLSCDFVKLSVIVSGEMPLKVVSLIALLDILNLLFHIQY